MATDHNRALCYASVGMAEKKNPHAVALGRLGGRAAMDAKTPKELEEFARSGGKVGGRKRADSLSAARRSEIAQKAARVRWDKKKKGKKRAGKKRA